MDECCQQTEVLLTSRFAINPYAPGQYLWDHLSYNFEHYPVDCLSGEYSIPRLEACLQAILSFQEKEDKPALTKLRNTLYERFEAKDFSDRLLAFWDEQKVKYENS